MTSPLRDLQRTIDLGNLGDENGLIGNPNLELEHGLIPRFVDLVDSEALLYVWPPRVPFVYTAKAYLDGKLDDLNERLMQLAPDRCNAKGMLDAFVRIQRAEDALSFARRFGVLGCCNHRLPSTHENRSVIAQLCEPMEFPFSHGTPLHWEPIDVWFVLAEGARSLLRVASAIYRSEEIDKADWQNAMAAVYKPMPPGLFRTLISPESRRGTVCSIVEQWLAIGGASHGLIWQQENDTPDLRLLVRDTGQPPTMAIIASQLMLAVAQASTLAICSGCTTIYRRMRRPQARRRNYCPSCQTIGLPSRDRQRAHRAR